MSRQQRPPELHRSSDGFYIHAAIDFGTDGIGVSYATNGEVYVHSDWPESKFAHTLKPKAIILLDDQNEPSNFGNDALKTFTGMKSARRDDQYRLFKRFKMSLFENEQEQKDGKVNITDELKSTAGVACSSEVVFMAVFKFIKIQTGQFLMRKVGKTAYYESLANRPEHWQWIVTVPAIWSDSAKNKMKQWITKSGLVNANIKNQCKIVYEPEAASLAIQHQIHDDVLIDDEKDEKKQEKLDLELHKYRAQFVKGIKYILCDAGGGTVDVVCHEILAKFGVREVHYPSGGKWGSCYIDDQFELFLDELFGNELMDKFKKEHSNVHIELIFNFQLAKASFYTDDSSETHSVKLPQNFENFVGERIYADHKEELEHFIEQSDLGQSGTVSLTYGSLKLSQSKWKEMFDIPSVNPTIAHIERILNEPLVMRNCKFLCLVGGLSCSPYFRHRMEQKFGLRSRFRLELILPQRPMLCVVEGAAYFGITENYIRARRLRFTYGQIVDQRKTVAQNNGVSADHIQRNTYLNAFDDKEYVKNCFQVLATKNEQIVTGDVKRKVTQRPNAQTLQVTIQIRKSDSETPKIKSDGLDMATIPLDFSNNDANDMNVVTEFHFDETLLKVYAYRESDANNKTEVEIDYDAHSVGGNAHVIFVCDISGSMMNRDCVPSNQDIIGSGGLNNRLGKLYESIYKFNECRVNKNCVDTCSAVLFESSARVVANKKEGNVDFVKDYLLNCKPRGGTNFYAAFRATDPLIDKNEQTVVMFMTDGESSDGGSANLVRGWKQQMGDKLKLFCITLKNTTSQVVSDICTAGGGEKLEALSGDELESTFVNVAMMLNE